MSRILIALVAAALPTLAAAQDAEPRPTLDEVMQGATAMTAMAQYLFVAREDGAWVCAININSNHFAALIAGDDVVVDQTVPGAVCVPASHFKNLME
ncbi:hypothetical protein [Sinisalibacter aestuarii]|nr:hypothetical protein [Sinisalibacter aestuarii]